MANEKVHSGNMRLTLNGEVIFDATGCTLTISRETKQRAATKDTSAGVSTKSTKTWNVGYNGLAIYAADGNDGHDFKALFDLMDDDSDTLPVAEFVPAENDYTHSYQGNVIITSLEGTFNVDEDATISLSAVGSGPLTAIVRS